MSAQSIDAIWLAYLSTLPGDHPHRAAASPSAWGFGDSPAMADALGQLVQQGSKTATASLVWEYEHDQQPMPTVGDMSIILDSSEKPLCVIETTELRILPYNEVDAEFAFAEGEGDRSLEYWREAHWRFFSRSCQRIGREISETMPILCERFRVVYRV